MLIMAVIFPLLVIVQIIVRRMVLILRVEMLVFIVQIKQVFVEQILLQKIQQFIIQ